LRGLAGIASAWVLIFVSTWSLQRLAALERPGLRGLVFGGVGLGIMGAGLLCMAFQATGWSSGRSWMALGVTALLVSLFSLPGFLATQSVEPAPVQRMAEKRPRVFGITLAYGILGFGYIIPATFLPAMAKQRNPDPFLFGWAWPVFGLAALISTLIAGSLMVRYSNRGVWGVSHLIMGVGVVLPLLLTGMTGIVLSALCVGGTFMVITSAGIQEARRLAPGDPAPLMARLTMAFAFGQILGPLCVSLLPAGPMSFALMLALAAGLLLTSGGLLLRARPQA
jgi:cyanate permease